MAATNDTHIEWECVACGSLIAENDGTVSVPLPYPTQPAPLLWSPLHDVCEDQSESRYGIPVEQLRTAAGIVRWTAHIYAKNWGHRTDWHRRVCGAVPMVGSGAYV
ncbi:MAG: hypothetical protein Q4F65_12200 [Propionibacteriaceae bacterium]|nr:hypothetical protein [Propionibacteriaceae bacterium]